MRKIDLYIADNKVDLDDNSFILFNYTMEDLSNPTIVKNSFSKQITLKGTANNNKVFGSIFRLDRQTQHGSSQSSGVHYDASRKTPFVIFNEANEIVESGYVKLDGVTLGREIEYKVTLYGGLGSFFYALMYNEDGSKKNLTSLRYKTLSGRYMNTPGSRGQSNGLDVIQSCWRYLGNPEYYETHFDDLDVTWCNIINFAPCYNGLPNDFSADKIICDQPYENVPRAIAKTENKQNGGTTLIQYSFKQGTKSNLMTLTNPHHEWEVRDLRWYLQRPIMSVKALIAAICDTENNGGWEVELSPSFFNAANHLYNDGWFTLPLIPTEDRQEENTLQNILSGTMSPMEYLVSFTKIFGLIFLADPTKKKIVIMPRQEFYSSEKDVIDLTDRVNRESISISPILADKHFYQYGNEVIGAWAEEYAADFNKGYAVQSVNTGNEFNMETEVVTSDIIFQDAVEVHERSLLYYSNELERDPGGGGYVENYVLPRYEQVKLQLWGISDGQTEQHMEEFDVECPLEWKRFPFNETYPLSDFLPKVQLHDSSNKPIDGNNVLLVFTGIKETPDWDVRGVHVRLTYRVTDDTDDMMTLNEGVPCWNYSPYNSREVTSLPSFRRCYTQDIDGDEVIAETYEWGVPAARGAFGVFHSSEGAKTIYNRFWKKYQSDRYDVDTYKMNCKVNLRGMNQGKDLMRRFFFYQGAIFVLNAIRNHSLTTWDDTECEFIKVQDKSNYQS